MGDGAQKIIHMLESHDIKLSGIYASDEFVRGHSFAGYQVKKLSQVRAEHSDRFISLLAFATEREPLLSSLYALSEELTLLAPDVEVADFAGEAFDFEYLEKNRSALEVVYSRLGDDISKRVFDGVLNFKLSGRLSYLKEITTQKLEIFTSILRPTSSEFYLDIGAFRGDTMEEFLKIAGGAYRLLGLEPDAKNFKKLDAYCSSLRECGINAEGVNAAGWNEDELLTISGGNGGKNGSVSPAVKNSGMQAKPCVPLAQQARVKEIKAVRIDSLFPSGGDDATFLKIDAEGAERKVLEGARALIKRAKPKLLVSAYHRNEDLFALPQAVLSIRDDYKIYLRHHPYIPAWETCFYFV